MSLDKDLELKIKAKIKEINKKLDSDKILEDKEFSKLLSESSYLTSLLKGELTRIPGKPLSTKEPATIEKYEELFGPLNVKGLKTEDKDKKPKKTTASTKKQTESKPSKEIQPGRRKALVERKNQIEDYISALSAEVSDVVKTFKTAAQKDKDFEAKVYRSLGKDVEKLLKEKQEIEKFLPKGVSRSEDETTAFLEKYEKEFGALNRKIDPFSKTAKQTFNIASEIRDIDAQMRALPKPGKKASSSEKQQYETFIDIGQQQINDLVLQLSSANPDLFSILVGSPKPKAAKKGPTPVKQKASEPPKTPKVKSSEKEAAKEVQKVVEQEAALQAEVKKEVASATVDAIKETKPAVNKKVLASLKGQATKAANKYGKDSEQYTGALFKAQLYGQFGIKPTASLNRPSIAPSLTGFGSTAMSGSFSPPSAEQLSLLAGRSFLATGSFKRSKENVTRRSVENAVGLKPIEAARSKRAAQNLNKLEPKAEKSRLELISKQRKAVEAERKERAEKLKLADERIKQAEAAKQQAKQQRMSELAEKVKEFNRLNRINRAIKDPNLEQEIFRQRRYARRIARGARPTADFAGSVPFQDARYYQTGLNKTIESRRQRIQQRNAEFMSRPDMAKEPVGNTYFGYVRYRANLNRQTFEDQRARQIQENRLARRRERGVRPAPGFSGSVFPGTYFRSGALKRIEKEREVLEAKQIKIAADENKMIERQNYWRGREAKRRYDAQRSSERFNLRYPIPSDRPIDSAIFNAARVKSVIERSQAEAERQSMIQQARIQRRLSRGARPTPEFGGTSPEFAYYGRGASKRAERQSEEAALKKARLEQERSEKARSVRERYYAERSQERLANRQARLANEELDKKSRLENEASQKEARFAARKQKLEARKAADALKNAQINPTIALPEFVATMPSTMNEAFAVRDLNGRPVAGNAMRKFLGGYRGSLRSLEDYTSEFVASYGATFGKDPKPPGADPKDPKTIEASAEALEKQNKGIRTFGGLMNSIVGDFFLISQLSYTFADIGTTLAGVFTQANAELEVYLTTLRSTLGTASKAENVFYNFAQAFALQVPFFETQDLISTVNKLAAEGFRGVQLTGNLDPAKGAKFEGSLVKSITDLASAFGKSPDQAVDAFISAAQNRFVRIRQFGISREDLKTFGFSGTADDSEGAVSALRQIIDLRYGGITETLGQTFKGAKSNIDDFLKTMSRLATKPAFDSVTSFMVEAIQYINLFEEGLSKAEGTFKSRASQNFVRYLEEDIGGALKKVADTILGFIRFLGENSAAVLGLAGLSVAPLIGKTLKGTGGAIIGSLGGLKEGIFGKPKYGIIGASIASFFGGKGLANNPNFSTPDGPTKAGQYFEHAKKRGDFSSMVRLGLLGAKSPTGLGKIGITAALAGLEKYGMQLNNAYAGMTRLGAAGAKTFASLTGFLNIAVPILKVVFIGALFEAAGAMSDLRKGIEDTGRAINLKALASSLKEQEKIVIQIFKNIANAFGATLGTGPESGAFLRITNAFVSITNQGLKAAELITSAFSGVGATIRKLFSNVKSGLGSPISIIPNIFKAGGDATKPIGKGFSALYGGSSLDSSERNAAMFGTSAALGGLWAAGSMAGQYAKSASEIEITKRFFTSSALKQAQNLGVAGVGKAPITLTISSATISVAAATIAWATGAFAAYTAGRESGDMNDVLFAERQNVFGEGGEKTLWDYTDIGSEIKKSAGVSAGALGRVASFTATGALIGSTIPILGTGLGATIGGIAGLGAEAFNLGKEAEMDRTADSASNDLQTILRSRRSAVLGQYALPSLLGGAGALAGSFVAPVAGTTLGGLGGVAAGVGLNSILENSPLRFLVKDTADTKTFQRQLIADGIDESTAKEFGKAFSDSNVAGLLATDSDNAEVAAALDKLLKPLEKEKEAIKKAFESGDIGSDLFEKQNKALDKHIKKWTDLRDEISAYGDLTKFRDKDLEESLAVDEKSLKSSNEAVDKIEKSFEQEEQEFAVIENQIRQASFSGQDTTGLRAKKDQMRAEQIQKTIARTNELGGIQLGIDATLSARQEEKKELQKQFEEERKKLEEVYANETVAKNLGITSKQAQNSLANAVSKYISGDTKNARSEIQGVLKREGVTEEESNKFLFQLVRDSEKAFGAKGRLETIQNFLNKQSEVSKNASKLFSDLVASISAKIQSTNETATTNYEAGIITIAEELNTYQQSLEQLLSVDTLAATEETKKQQALVKRKRKQFREAFRGRGLEGEILSQPLNDALQFTQDFNKIAKDLNTQDLASSFNTLNTQINNYNKLLSVAIPETDQYRQIADSMVAALKEAVDVYDQIILKRRSDIDMLRELQRAQEDVSTGVINSASTRIDLSGDLSTASERRAAEEAIEASKAQRERLSIEQRALDAKRASEDLEYRMSAIVEDTNKKLAMRRSLSSRYNMSDLYNPADISSDKTREEATQILNSYKEVVNAIASLESDLLSAQEKAVSIAEKRRSIDKDRLALLKEMKSAETKSIESSNSLYESTYGALTGRDLDPIQKNALELRRALAIRRELEFRAADEYSTVEDVRPLAIEFGNILKGIRSSGVAGRRMQDRLNEQSAFLQVEYPKLELALSNRESPLQKQLKDLVSQEAITENQSLEIQRTIDAVNKGLASAYSARSRIQETMPGISEALFKEIDRSLNRASASPSEGPLQFNEAVNTFAQAVKEFKAAIEYDSSKIGQVNPSSVLQKQFGSGRSAVHTGTVSAVFPPREEIELKFPKIDLETAYVQPLEQATTTAANISKEFTDRLIREDKAHYDQQIALLAEIAKNTRDSIEVNIDNTPVLNRLDLLIETISNLKYNETEEITNPAPGRSINAEGAFLRI